MALLTIHWALDFFVVVVISLLTALYVYSINKLRYWEKRGVTQIPPKPFVGNFWDCILLKKRASDFMKELYDEHKSLRYVGFYVFHKPFLLIRDSELVKHVLAKDFNVFSDRFASADTNDRIGYANLFMIKNPAWKVLRGKLTPIFTSGKLKKMSELMLEVCRDFEAHMQSINLQGNGKDIDVKEMCAQITTDFIGTTAYGIKANAIKDPNAIFREYGRKIFSYNFTRGFEMLAIFYIPTMVKPMGAKFFGKDVSQYLRNIFWEVIKQREVSGEKRNDLVDLLLELKKTYGDQDLGGFKFDGDDLVAQAAIFFTGGFETSSTAMAFALYELAKEPAYQSKLRKEITDALEQSNGKVTYEMAMTLPYLDMVVSESLRMYPPLGFLDRVTTEEYKVPGSDLVLEKGTPVIIPMLGLHYDPQYYPNPEKFDPERFNEENKKSRPSFVYFPFGDGPHACIGLRLGLLQAKLGLIHILKKHEVRPCKKTPIPMHLDPKGVTTSPIGGLYLNVRTITTEAG